MFPGYTVLQLFYIYQFVLHVMLFRPVKYILYFYISVGPVAQSV